MGTFVPHGGTTVSALNGAGVIVTSRGPVAPGNTTRTYTAHGSVGGTVGGPAGTGAPRSAGPGNLGGPVSGRPTATAPHSSPVAVVRPPSTFTSVGNGGRNSGVTPVNGSGFGSGRTGGTTAGPLGGTTGATDFERVEWIEAAAAGGRPAGGTSSCGGTGQAGGGVAPGGTGGASGKH